MEAGAQHPNWNIIHKPKEEDANAATIHEQTDAILSRQRELWNKAAYEKALKLYDQFMACQDCYVKGAIESALNCLSHAFRLYGAESVICSFNGGKDAVVILHLVRAAHAHYYRTLQQQQSGKTSVTPIRPRVIYFEHKHEFPEILRFLHDTVQTHDLEMLAFEEGTKFGQGLQILVQHNHAPLAFVLGTRTTDPNAGQQGEFAPSSHYMPPFMRVNPVLDWTYGHVWHFLRLFQLSYCCLYDQGYTSLGTVKDTLPCPALAVAGTTTADSSGMSSSSNNIPRYWPAYMLRDWDQERAGRITKEKKESKKPPKQRQPPAADDSSNNDSSIGRLSAFTERRFRSEDSSSVDDPDTSVVSFDDDINIRTVGMLVIGDEILKGLTVDTNTAAAAASLRDKNVLLKRVVVVSDDLDDIVKEIGRLKKEVDAIITSGGVGPTHDDVTIKSVAEALGCKMCLHAEMAELLRNKMKSPDNNDGAELTEAQMKMATLPDKSKLRYISDDPDEWPVLQCSNIFILPGVPEYFEKKIENVAEYLSCQLQRSVAYKVVLSVDENSIVPVLNQVVENHPNVSIGSYPFVSQPEFKTVITVEGRLMSGGRSNSAVFSTLEPLASTAHMDRDVHMALDELINALPNGSVLRVENDNLNLFD